MVHVYIGIKITYRYIEHLEYDGTKTYYVFFSKILGRIEMYHVGFLFHILAGPKIKKNAVVVSRHYM